jgi:hypothetical protein
MRAGKEAPRKKADQAKHSALRSLLMPYLFPVLLPLLGLGLFLFGVFLVGRLTRAQIRDQDRYAVAFASIHCYPPPPQERTEFLAEVQYLAGMPDRLRLLDDDLTARLAEAFARHPWVEQVQRVTIVPPRQLDVQLVYRTPALAVIVAGQRRAVDSQGVVLPALAGSEGLPVYSGPSTPPLGPAGQPWGDRAIEAAARTAGYLLPHQGRFHVAHAEASAEGVVVRTVAGTRILWGRPPGKEASGEASALLKRQRLLSYCERHGDLDHPDGPYEHDVRPSDRPLLQPLSRSDRP